METWYLTVVFLIPITASFTKQKACKENPPTVLNAYITSAILDEYKHGTVLQYKCGQAFEQKGNNSVTCQDGQWIPDSDDLIECIIGYCSPIYSHEIDNGRIKSMSGEVGTYAEFECYDGYELDGSAQILCMADRTWHPEIPKCKPVSCPAPKRLMNGRLTQEIYNGVLNIYQSTIRYECDKGYKMVGPQFRKCQSDRTWSGSDTTCEEIFCDKPLPPENGNVHLTDNLLKVGSQIEYICDKQYTIEPITSQFAICTEHGDWSRPTPRCTKTCKVLALSNGFIRENTRWGSIITEDTYVQINTVLFFTCNNGYEKYANGYGPDGTLKCVNGTLLPGSPECKPKRCSIEPTFDLEYFIEQERVLANYVYNGTLMEARCRDRMELVRSSIYLDRDQISVTCNFGVLEPVSLKCVDKRCSITITIENGHFRNSRNGIVVAGEKISSGSNIRLLCSRGYELYSESKAMYMGTEHTDIKCYQGSFSAEIPKCTPRSLRLTVSPPQLLARAGENITLRCISTSRGHYNMKWSKVNGVLSPRASENKGLLQIPQVTAADAGRYRCVSGSSEEYAVVEITGRPVVNGGDTQNETKIVNIGDRVEMQCNGTGTPLATIRWIKDDGPLPAYVILEDRILVIPDAKMEDTGTYTCSVVSHTESVQSNVELYVRGRPLISTPHTSITAPSGDIALLGCQAKGYPIPQITWNRKDGQMPSDHTIDAGNLKIPRVRTEDAGRYICSAHNQYGQSNASVDLKIEHIIKCVLEDPGMHVTSLGNRTVATAGETVNVSCKDGYQIVFSNKQENTYQYDYPVSESTADTFETNTNETVMSFGDGNYKCGNNGTWEPVIPFECKPIICESFDNNLENGKIVYLSPNEHAVGNVASFICDPGYIRNGPENRTCQTNGTWSGTCVTCQSVTRNTSITCPAPCIPEGARKTGSYTYEIGAIVQFNCPLSKPQESTESRNIRHCINNGNSPIWNGTQINCRDGVADNGSRALGSQSNKVTETPDEHSMNAFEIPECESLSDVYKVIQTGVVQGKLSHLTIVEISCNKSQAPFDYLSLATCKESSWTPRKPYCENTCTIQSVPGTLYNYTSSKDNVLPGPVLSGRNIKVTCENGYISVPHHSDVSTCTNGVWKPSLSICEKKAVSCATPPILNAIIDPQKKTYAVGENVSITGCLNSLFYEGARSLFCSKDGSWHGHALCTSYCPYDKIYWDYTIFKRGKDIGYKYVSYRTDNECYDSCAKDQNCKAVYINKYYPTIACMHYAENTMKRPQDFITLGGYYESIYNKACKDTAGPDQSVS